MKPCNPHVIIIIQVLIQNKISVNQIERIVWLR